MINIYTQIEKFFNYYKKHNKTDLPQDSYAIQDILDLWKAQKKGLYTLFGNNVIYKKPIKIAIPEEEIIDSMLNDYVISSSFDLFIRLGKPYGDNLLNFVTNPEYYVTNYYNGPSFRIKNIQVKNGCKTMRTLKKILSVLNCPEENIKKFENRMSLIRNQKYLEGNLCISIHPLDFLTLSVNNSGWSTCYNPFVHGGYYFRACMQLLTSPNAVVVYLESKHPMKLDELEWNNKKWREIFFVSEDYIVSTSGYPYNNQTLTLEALNLIKKISKAKYQNQILSGTNIPITLDLKEKSCYYEYDFKDTIKYYTLSADYKQNDIYIVQEAGPDICISCGKINPEYAFECCDRLVGRECDPRKYCDECGICEDEMQIKHDPVDGKEYCEFCAQFTEQYSNYSHTWHMNEKNYEIHPAANDKEIFFTSMNIAESELKFVLVEKTQLKTNEKGEYYVYLDEITENGYKAIYENINHPPKDEWEFLEYATNMKSQTNGILWNLIFLGED